MEYCGELRRAHSDGKEQSETYKQKGCRVDGEKFSSSSTILFGLAHLYIGHIYIHLQKITYLSTTGVKATDTFGHLMNFIVMLLHIIAKRAEIFFSILSPLQDCLPEA